METATAKTLSVGDSVYRTWDVTQEPGVIVAATDNKGQWLVSMQRGKTWIYHSNELEPLES